MFHFGTSSQWGGRRYRPYAFTEQGVAMLSSVLGSRRAIQVNIEIMRAFVRLRRALESERLDVTLPGRPLTHGRLHPSTLMMRDLARIFNEMGFQIYRSREVETDEVNFQLLNIPPFHPARDNWSTFYVADSDERVLLRTHTSPGRKFFDKFPGIELFKPFATDKVIDLVEAAGPP